MKEFEEVTSIISHRTFPPAALVLFNNMSNGSKAGKRSSQSNVFGFDIRMSPVIMDTNNFKVQDRYWNPRARQNPSDKDTTYLSTGFIDIQESISEAILSVFTSRPDKLDRPASSASLFSEWVPGQEMKFFPSTCYTTNRFIGQFSKMLPQFLIFSWIFTAMLTVKYILEEKNQRLKEFIKIMGVSSITYWLSWITLTCIIFTIIAVVMAVLLKFGRILPLADYGLLLLLFLSYGLAVTAFSFLCSTFFTNPNLGGVVTGLLFFIFYLPFPLLVSNISVFSVAVMYSASLSCQVAFGIGVYYVTQSELQGFGAQWSDFWNIASSSDVFSVGKCIVMLWVDAIIYFLLASYIDTIFPGTYGQRKPFYYPFTRDFWQPRVSPTYCDLHDDQTRASDYFEEAILDDCTSGVIVKNLTKVYKKGQVPALNRLCATFKANQITSLLGHNGAGKSTLISILTGIHAATSGEAYVSGHEVHRSPEKVRDHLGFCPQYNILFDQLTVSEHIYFYSALRGHHDRGKFISKREEKENTDRLLSLLGFADKRDDKSRVLSGGQKRKLSVAVAFVGGPTVVLLDEPTSGVDPYSRRSIWEFIMQLKCDRTIILTTHHMDEADVLGDRIAILSQGRLRCLGSSLFLKDRHGQGYHLSLDLNKALEGSPNSEAVPAKSLAYVRKWMPQAEIFNVTPSEIVIQLPSKYASDGTFSDFFKQLESTSASESLPAELQEVGISAYGLSDTSLEEIFLKLVEDPSQHETVDIKEGEDIGRDENEALQKYENRQHKEIDVLKASDGLSKFTDGGILAQPATRHSLSNRRHSYPSNQLASQSSRVQIDCKLRITVRQQFRALFFKRFHQFKRAKKGWVIEFLLPVLLVLLAFSFLQVITTDINNPSMPMHPWFMADTPVKPILNTFFENNLYAKADPLPRNEAGRRIAVVGEQYERAISSSYGWVGARCTAHSLYHFIPKHLAFCKPGNDIPVWTPAEQLTAEGCVTARQSTSKAVCYCNKLGLQCPADAVEPNPPPRMNLPTTDVLFNLTAYNVTQYLLRTDRQFILRRFGGLSFHMSPRARLRGMLEEILSPNLTIYDRLGQLTPVQRTESQGSRVNVSDTFWRALADTVRLMLPPTHNLRVWFNNKGYVSATGYLNLLQNMQLRMLLSNNSSIADNMRLQDIAIVVNNHPFKLPGKPHGPTRSDIFFELTLAIFTIMALSFIPTNFVTYLVAERQTNSKHLQFISGLNSNIYWLSVYAWDFVNYCIPAFLCILVFVAFQYHSFVGSDVIGAFILVILVYGLAILPMLYPASFFLKVPSTALVVLVTFNVILGSATLLITVLLEALATNDPNLTSVSSVLAKLFLIFPQFCLGRSLYNLALRASILSLSDSFNAIDTSAIEDPFSWEVIGRPLLAMCLHAILYFALVLLIEQRFLIPTIRTHFYKNHPAVWRRRIQRLRKRLAEGYERRDTTSATQSDSTNDTSPSVPEDVQSERERVYSLHKRGDLLQTPAVYTLDVTKFFARKKKPSVNSLTLAVNPGECFGLLGVNGAGKTTTFRMLTGILAPSLGSIYIQQFNVVDEKRKAHRSLGLCPQYDALLDLLTGRETLTLYARLRGFPEADIPEVVEELLKNMTLTPHADKVAGAYSGGNRRKLSTAIAIIGSPQVIFLDEPTSGMDPGAKRFIWDQVMNLVESGKSVILTSHSMEECEALCDRIGIMVNGQLRCLGSVQNLKSRFGSGYLAEVRISEAEETNASAVHSKILHNFPGVTSTRVSEMCHHYEFPRNTVKLSRLFECLNELRQLKLVKQYSVKQTTLDQVFVNFAKSQMERVAEDVELESLFDEDDLSTDISVLS